MLYIYLMPGEDLVSIHALAYYYIDNYTGTMLCCVDRCRYNLYTWLL